MVDWERPHGPATCSGGITVPTGNKANGIASKCGAMSEIGITGEGRHARSVTFYNYIYHRHIWCISFQRWRWQITTECVTSNNIHLSFHDPETRSLRSRCRLACTLSEGWLYRASFLPRPTSGGSGHSLTWAKKKGLMHPASSVVIAGLGKGGEGRRGYKGENTIKIQKKYSPWKFNLQKVLIRQILHLDTWNAQFLTPHETKDWQDLFLLTDPSSFLKWSL